MKINPNYHHWWHSLVEWYHRRLSKQLHKNSSQSNSSPFSVFRNSLMISNPTKLIQPNQSSSMSHRKWREQPINHSKKLRTFKNSIGSIYSVKNYMTKWKTVNCSWSVLEQSDANFWKIMPCLVLGQVNKEKLFWLILMLSRLVIWIDNSCSEKNISGKKNLPQQLLQLYRWINSSKDILLPGLIKSMMELLIFTMKNSMKARQSWWMH